MLVGLCYVRERIKEALRSQRRNFQTKLTAACPVSRVINPVPTVTTILVL